MFQQLAKNGTVSGISLPSTSEGADRPSLGLIQESDGRSEGQYQGVLQAIERLRDELPAQIAADEAWSPGVICPIWES